MGDSRVYESYKPFPRPSLGGDPAQDLLFPAPEMQTQLQDGTIYKDRLMRPMTRGNYRVAGGWKTTSTRTELFDPRGENLLSMRGRTLLKCVRLAQGVETSLSHAFTHTGTASDGGNSDWGTGTGRSTAGAATSVGSETTSFITNGGGLAFRPYMIAKFRTPADTTTLRHWVYMWDGTVNMNVDSPAGATIFGVRFSDGVDTSWTLCSRKAADAGLTTTATGVPYAASTGYLMEFYYTGTHMVVWINGVETSQAVGTMSTTEPMPGLGLKLTTTGAVTRVVTINGLYLSYD